MVATSDTPPRAEWFSRVDGCPGCVSNVEAPFGAEATPDGFVALYKCTACGHRWTCSWRED